MAKKPTAADAQLILQLYDLRRESELRKSRNWWTSEFWPANADDFAKIASAMGTQENAWLRQASSYWSMAALLVLQGTLNADLFLHPSNSGEMYFILAKVHPFLKELREKMGDPNLLGNIEKVIQSTKFSRERFKWTLTRVAAARERRPAAKTA
jgi:hypothetical protein